MTDLEQILRQKAKAATETAKSLGAAYTDFDGGGRVYEGSAEALKATRRAIAYTAAADVVAEMESSHG